MTRFLNPYRCKNGKVILYINNNAKQPSYAMTERYYSSKATQGEKNARAAVFARFAELEPQMSETEFLSRDLVCEKHTLDGLTFYAVDAGMNDGGYLAYKGNIYPLAEFKGWEA